VPAQVLDEPEELARFTRWEQGEGGQRLGVSSLQLSGMHCAACAGIIEGALSEVPGVCAARVSASGQRATVRWDPQRTQASALFAAVRAVGYGVAPDAAASTRELRRHEHRDAVWRLFVATFLAMQVMMLATPSYVAAPGDLSDDLRRLLNWGSWMLSVPVVWFTAMPFLRGAWHSLRRRRIHMDVPVGLGIAVTFVASSVATFDPTGPLGHEVYFDSLTMFLAFLWLGRFLETRARHRAAEALESAMNVLPSTAVRLREDGQIETVSVHRLGPGDVVRVVAGAVVPADGPLLSPAADVSEAMLTGESSAVARRCGEALLAGSVNAGRPFEMRVERVGADTRHEAIVALMRETLSQRPASARLADRWAGPFLWVVLFLAAGSAAVWSVIDPSRALWIAVAVLIVTCPCALSLATPATLVAAAGGLARRGVLLRRIDALEAMAGVHQVFFDKTGTLTQDRLELEGVEVLSAHRLTAFAPPPQALAVAASLAAWSAHPASLALVHAAASQGEARAVPPWTHVTETAGAGVEGWDAEGRRWRLGSSVWASSGARSAQPGARVVLSCEGEAVAEFRLAEALREGAVEAVRAVRDRGVGVALLSGDDPLRARQLASRLDLSEVGAGLSPEDKLAHVRKAQSAGSRVAMVGDGINDAPVLAAADVSMAMGHAALAAQQEADAVIVSGNPMGVVDLLHSSRRALTLVRQNLAWSAGYNAACIPLAMVGWMPPWAAGLGMAASSLWVILNAQRAARSTGGVDTGVASAAAR
jgi:Cu2+-exporting ATPase